MNILITGIAGPFWVVDWQIGLLTINILFSMFMDHMISPAAMIQNINSKVKFYKIDLVNNSVHDIFKKHQFDYVLHFAAYAAEGLSDFIEHIITIII